MIGIIATRAFNMVTMSNIKNQIKLYKILKFYIMSRLSFQPVLHNWR